MKRLFKNILIYLGVQITVFIILGIPLVFKGPFTNIKENWVLTAMTTMNHQYLAKWFVSEEEIQNIIDKHKIKETSEEINLGDINININSINQHINTDNVQSYPGAETLYNESGIKIETFREGKFKAYVTIINDPSRIKLGVTNELGSRGEKLEHMVNRYGAIVGINAGGFVDEGGHGNGGTPLGFVVENNNVVYADSKSKQHVVGFNSEDKLVLGEYNTRDISSLSLRDAINFRPFLILNGKPQITEGNGGWGIAPRTAIGQRKDGKVVFLVIDGRQPSSIGATLREVQDIMLFYGVYNCANLDGGSSSQLVLNGYTVNKPSSSAGPRNLATAFIVK